MCNSGRERVQKRGHLGRARRSRAAQLGALAGAQGAAGLVMCFFWSFREAPVGRGGWEWAEAEKVQTGAVVPWRPRAPSHGPFPLVEQRAAGSGPPRPQDQLGGLWSREEREGVGRES